MKISAFYENIETGAVNEGIPIEKALAQLKDDGMEQVCICCDTLKKDITMMQDMLRKAGVGVEGLYGYFSFAEDPLNIWYKDIIDLAVKMNADNILIVPGLIERNSKSVLQLKKNMWTGLKNAVLYGEEQGVTVSIEDYDDLKAPYCNISGISEFLQNVPGLRLSFDTGNFVMEHEDEVKAFELLRDHICTVHLKDRGRAEKLPGRKNLPMTVCADGDRICTVPAGDGFIHIKEILSKLRENGFDGGLVAEMYGYPEQNMYQGIRRSVRWIRNTWQMDLMMKK